MSSHCHRMTIRSFTHGAGIKSQITCNLDYLTRLQEVTKSICIWQKVQSDRRYSKYNEGQQVSPLRLPALLMVSDEHFGSSVWTSWCLICLWGCSLGILTDTFSILADNAENHDVRQEECRNHVQDGRCRQSVQHSWDTNLHIQTTLIKMRKNL